jgi:ABC-type branched-subunit amino acid transport system substrate-binding protein
LRLASRAPAALVALLLTGCGGLASGSAAGPSTPGLPGNLERTVKVALVQSFSGSRATAGRRAANGARLEIERLNARGGLLARHVELVTADDGSNPDKAAELVREQLADSRVRLLVGPDSGAGRAAVGDLVRRAQVPQCLTAIPDSGMSGSGFSFRVAPSEADRLGALLSYLRRDHPEVARVGLVVGSQPPVDPDQALVAQHVGGHGLAYAGGAGVGPGDGEAGAALQQLVAEGTQAAVVGGPPEIAASVAAAVSAAGLRGQFPLLGLDGFADYSFAASARDDAVGSVFSGAPQPSLAGQPETSWPAGYRDFVQRAGPAYGYGPDGAQVQAAPAFTDCLLQWSRSVQQAGSFAGPAVARAWEKLDLPAAETALGVAERGSPSNHTTVAADAVVVYSWVKDGSGYRLRQVG